MNETPTTGYQAQAWIDRFAIGMAALCAVHCLLMPVLLIALPIIATSFFAHEDFHLWMLLLVLPSTCIAIFLGCRKHKDRWTAVLSAIGLVIITGVVLYESQSHACGDCGHHHGPFLSACAWFNTLGGLFLAAAHIRNFRLCRKSCCTH